MSTVSPGSTNPGQEGATSLEPPSDPSSAAKDDQVIIKTEPADLEASELISSGKSALDDITIDVGMDIGALAKEQLDLPDLQNGDLSKDLDTTDLLGSTTADTESNGATNGQADELDKEGTATVDIDFDPSFFSLDNLDISKDKDGKTTIDGISFEIDGEHQFKQELLDDDKDLDGIGKSIDTTNDPFAEIDLKNDDMFKQDLDQLQDLDFEKDDLFKDGPKDGIKEEDMFDVNDLSKSDLFREMSKSLSEELPDLDKLSNSIDSKTFDPSTSIANLFSTPRQADRAQSEALETHIQKPTLQPYPASVPHSPTKAVGPPSTLFLPRSFNSPLSKVASVSPSKKAVQLSKLVQSDKSSTLQAINGATSENRDVSFVQSDEAPRVSAYARLDFSSSTFYVQTLQVILGRGAEKGTGMVDVDLGPVKAISRRHAKIFYNFGTQRFELSVLGRNGAFVDEVFIDAGSTVPLTDGYDYNFYAS